MIKIDIISGFLGAGKTTLIRKLFETGFKNEKVVIIENEFGDISIDNSFLKDSGVKIKEINSGCICCSLVGDFSTSINELISTYSPDRIIIEPSGVGKLTDIVDAIKKTSSQLEINILATVVDAIKAKMHLRNFGEFFLNQIEKANTIILTKVENVSETQIEEVLHIIKEHNKNANVITTSLNQINPETLLKTLESKKVLLDELVIETLHEHHHHEDGCCCGHNHHHEEGCHEHHDECHCHEHHHEHNGECHCHEHHEDGCCEHEHVHDEHCSCGHEHHNHHADEIFTTWGKETSKAVSKENLLSFLNALDNEELGIVVRCKGILKASDNDKWYYFDYVSGEKEIRLGEVDYSGRIVVIGSKINETQIAELFERI